MDKRQKKMLEELPTLGPWLHKIQLTDTVSTSDNGTNPEYVWQQYSKYLPKNLSGKTVLDIGANSGYHSIKMKQLGASRVVSVENDELGLKQLKFLSEWYDVKLEIVKEEAHTYCLTTDERFDFVLFMGLFYHLKYPVLVLDRLAEMTKQTMVIKSQVIGPKINDFVPKENYSHDDQNLMNEPDYPKMYFIEKKFNGGIGNWWLPNESALICLLRNVGMKIRAKPVKGIFVCEPTRTLGKKIIDKKFIFPKFEKLGYKNLPGQV